MVPELVQFGRGLILTGLNSVELDLFNGLYLASRSAQPIGAAEVIIHRTITELIRIQINSGQNI
jgi:hypothetical protein